MLYEVFLYFKVTTRIRELETHLVVKLDRKSRWSKWVLSDVKWPNHRRLFSFHIELQYKCYHTLWHRTPTQWLRSIPNGTSQLTSPSSVFPCVIHLTWRQLSKSWSSPLRPDRSCSIGTPRCRKTGTGPCSRGAPLCNEKLPKETLVCAVI